MSGRVSGRPAEHGRQYAFTHLVGMLPLTTPMSATWNVHGTGALGHVRSFARAPGRTLKRQFHPRQRTPISRPESRVKSRTSQTNALIKSLVGGICELVGWVEFHALQIACSVKCGRSPAKRTLDATQARYATCMAGSGTLSLPAIQTNSEHSGTVSLVPSPTVSKSAHRFSRRPPATPATFTPAKH
jgi:hypothetical protein